jgi:hypothetical protein
MAIKCANCEKSADYTTADPGVNPVNYCASCLPTWLRDRAAAGHFPLVEPTPKTKEKTAKSPE